MNDEPIDRGKLTFEEAEGFAPIPVQLQLKAVSPQLRATLWAYVHQSVSASENEYTGEITGTWLNILIDLHVMHYHRMIDSFTTDWGKIKPTLRRIFEKGEYVDVFGFLQAVMRHPHAPVKFAPSIEHILKTCRAAYCVIGGNTISPIASPHEANTLQKAVGDTTIAGFNGARQHLQSAAEYATLGKWADSIRESVHAVEAAARILSPGSHQLGPALATLGKNGMIHGALKKGFSEIYGFTSDESGIRHALLDKDSAEVDETDALFMLGACAAFVSYLINKGRQAGLLTT